MKQSLQTSFLIKGKQEYKIVSKINQGCSSTHYLVVGDYQKEQFSLKQINKVKIDEEGSIKLCKYIYIQRIFYLIEEINEYYQKEISFIRKNISENKQHLNIVNFIDFIENENSSEAYLVQEYCNNGNLYQFITNNTNISEIKIIEISLQIAKGIQYLHSQNIVHRDLKPESILLSNVGDKLIFKITDFGFSTFGLNMSSILGTINYMAPEIFKQEQYGKPVDIWSFGCLIYELGFRKQIFSDFNMSNLAKKISNFTGLQNKELQNEKLMIYEIISLCLNPNQKQRINIDDLVLLLEKNLQTLESEINKNDKSTLQTPESNLNLNPEGQIFTQMEKKQPQYNEQNKIEEQKSELYMQFMITFSDSKNISPNIGGFFKKLATTQQKPSQFVLKNKIYRQQSSSSDNFYLNLFHFLLSGQLLFCLRNLEQMIKYKNDEESVDSFQRWVAEILQFSFDMEERENKKMFDLLKKALAQISKVKNIYFRINTYLAWMQDPNFCKQIILLATYLYQQMVFQKRILSQVNLIIVEDDENLQTIVEQSGLCDCLIVNNSETEKRSIVMQVSYSKALFDTAPNQAVANDSNQGVKQLFHQFRSTFIQEGFVKYWKNIVETKLFLFKFNHYNDNFSPSFYQKK